MFLCGSWASCYIGHIMNPNDDDDDDKKSLKKVK